jgi:hypothetical protein
MWLRALFAALLATTLPADANTFPIKDSKSAIAIAKAVCRGNVGPSLKWQADLDTKGESWVASTMPNITVAKSV